MIVARVSLVEVIEGDPCFAACTLYELDPKAPRDLCGHKVVRQIPAIVRHFGESIQLLLVLSARLTNFDAHAAAMCLEIYVLHVTIGHLITSSLDSKGKRSALQHSFLYTIVKQVRPYHGVGNGPMKKHHRHPPMLKG